MTYRNRSLEAKFLKIIFKTFAPLKMGAKPKFIKKCLHIFLSSFGHCPQ